MLLLSVTLALTSFALPEPDPYVPPLAIHEDKLMDLPYGEDPRWFTYVIHVAYITEVPVWIACRFIGQESVGNPLAGVWNERAVSRKGALGLTQTMPVNVGLFSELYFHGQPWDPFDPYQSIWAGLHYLADQHERTGSWRVALMAFNGGLGHWLDPKKYGEWQPESINYVRAILGGDK